MKKKSGSRIVRVITRIINVRKWVDWDRMKSFTLYLVNGVKRLFVPQEPTHVEAFDEAVKKLKLNEADLIIKQKALFRLSVIMVIAAFMLLIYMGYQLFYGSWKATIISLVVVMIALVLAFRYHFWYYQIKQRKLGCTVKEWYRQGLLGEKE
ncbi:TPA: type IV secretion protein IcmV [Legionella pneumophila subsp. pneumophila]|uniref:Intracellular multiplication protein IcmV n=1 Tax=Legionella pneumophila (strain Lens) TaxID=297245 RepID=Q5WTB1_LEGPL|nr:type IVB secretion system protein IcmV [Legionella pneumophila]AOW53551.1 type IV secretion protein IcmV [Legionella pneumophila subsp. pneumophila]AOW55554.1 type IV secretion protein IcmV [Legionella pneumophila subsp. pneumophila]AOW58889.1 type IV secretion protein IcmV [Legionella pneumophila subsp. pneumophila]AOW60923.1 type IV secretion protein IcmV [Legionella pneumophila subsp. pneumophila]AOW64349.1 type IV secretion protein IcmV [Legionella pneumophila subsp. pneumophila]